MTDPPRFLTQHPDPAKKGVNIDKAKYDLIRRAIVGTLEGGQELTYTQLVDAVHGLLEGRFEGSLNWYVVTVKLDLEARGVIERVPRTRPQRLRLVAEG